MKGLALVGALACAAVACGGNTVRLGTSGGSGSSGGGDGGATSIASEIQETPTNLVSDGTSLFWVSCEGSGGPVSSMPVGGGPIAAVVPGLIGGGFLAVDDANVYYVGQSGGIDRAPKGGGGSPTLVNEAGASIAGVTVLGTSAYWVEFQPGVSPGGGPLTVKTAPLVGGSVSTITEFTGGDPGESIIGVTTTAVFISGFGTQLSSFPITSGVPDGGTPAQVPGPMQQCNFLVSDTDAVYCDTGSSINAVASDGTTTTLGMVVDESGISCGNGSVAFDETYVYWLDNATVGTIMRVPKTGGTATIIARDTSPVAIAVDANAVYWSDEGGNIMRLAK
jgi:hypothetical protein